MFDRKMYVVCKVIMTFEQLKQEGRVEGGPRVNKTKLMEIIEAAESKGTPEPTDDEIDEAVAYMIEGGQFERDFNQLISKGN